MAETSYTGVNMIRFGYEVYTALVSGGCRRQMFPAVTIIALVLMGTVPFLGAETPSSTWNSTAALIPTDTQSFVGDCRGADAQTDVANPSPPDPHPCQSYDEDRYETVSANEGVILDELCDTDIEFYRVGYVSPFFLFEFELDGS